MLLKYLCDWIPF